MRNLHIVQGEIDGDKTLLDCVAGSRSGVRWSGPAHAAVGDDVVVYIGGYGFYATARVESPLAPRRDSGDRAGFALGEIRLIQPAISLASIARRIPALAWARHARGVHTPEPAVADCVRELIRRRRRLR